MHKVILFSQVPLPYSKIGSWTTLYDNFLRENTGIDILICPKPEQKYTNIEYECFSINNSPIDRSLRKVNLRKPWHEAIVAFERVIQPEHKYIVHIIDNYGLYMAITNYLEEKNIRSNYYIHYFYHGYPSFKNDQIYSKIDELTLLTHKSYQEIKANARVFPCRVSVLHNGIDTQKFKPVPLGIKQKYREEFKVAGKKLFIWCSQDRPKKGLHLILDVWKKLTAIHDDIELWIIGTEIKQNTDSIKYIGKVPNDELPKYYQAGDVYLFSTLCQEGFGLSLIEAKHCGCYCIASALGGVPEVLDYGKYGKLVENPNFINEWVVAIEEYLNGRYENIPFPRELYSKEVWNKSMNVLIDNAKQSIK